MKITIEISKEDLDFIKRLPRAYLSDDFLNIRLYKAIQDGDIKQEERRKK